MKNEGNPKSSGDGILQAKAPEIFPERIPAGPTEKIPDPKKGVAVPSAQFYVAPGRAVVCKRGAIPQCMEVKTSDFANEMQDIEHLIKIGVVLRGKS